MNKARFKKTAAAFLLAAITIVPAYAVFNERNLSQTLSVLRTELHQETQKMERSRRRITNRDDRQHGNMIEMIKKCNELGLILYSQNQDYTFDMTYALNEVTEQYDEFEKNKMPYDEIIERLDNEIERYEHLIESLRRLPPILEEISDVPDSLKVRTDSLMKGMRSQMPRRDSSARFERPMNDSARMNRAPRPEMAGPTGPSAAESAAANAINSLVDLMIPDTGNDNNTTARAEASDSTGRRSFMLDEKGQADRDSCLAYARTLLRMYTGQRRRIIRDSEHYDQLGARLQETYEYAEKRYLQLQKKIFIEGQDNYFKVLSTLPSYSSRAFEEAKAKYGISGDREDRDSLKRSEWRGPVVVGFIFFVLIYLGIATLLSNIIVQILTRKVKALKTENFKKRRFCLTLLCGTIIFAISIAIADKFVNQNFFIVASGLLLIYAWLLAAILLSLLIRIPAQYVNKGLRMYAPTLLLGLIVITFRIIFIPNRLVNLIFPPVLLGFTIWQLFTCRHFKRSANRNDVTYAWITLAVMVVTTVASWMGYVLLSVQFFIWWLFQLAAIETITSLSVIIDAYERKFISKRRVEYKRTHNMVGENNKGAFIEVTWFFDFIKIAVIPILAIVSIPFCFYQAAQVFDLTEVCKAFYYKPFFNLADKNGSEILHLSLYKIVLVSSLFFIFRYISYLIKSVYRHRKLQSFMEKSGKSYVHTNEINFTLANNVVSILVWGSYIIMAILLLKIPMGAISIVAAGLATGLGLALKDVLNNFIYGIQLMSGRLRVGDWIECDGVRGKVDSITYQSTQILTLEGAIMAFTNTALFNKNFKNLTRDNSYEFVKIPVGVHYGADIEKVREVLTEALQTLMTKDKFGRNIVDPKRGITVSFDDFGASSVDLAVKQFVIVEEKLNYIAHAKEVIYNALNSNGIEIPFPQRDIHIISK